jgi:hypothetical protein
MRSSLSTMDDGNPYIWHHTENATNNMHETNYQKEFSYSVLRLDKFTKTRDQLKDDLDKWISLFLHGSKMVEKEVDDVFGDELIFQEIFQILKLDNLTSKQLEKYYRLEEIRYSNENSMRLDYEKAEREAYDIGQTKAREVSSRMYRKIYYEINRNKNAIINGTIIAGDIIGSIVDENFDQGFMKVTERDKLIAINRLKQQGYKNIGNLDYKRGKWSNEQIQELKEKIIKKLECVGLIPPKPKQEDELVKEKLVQKIFNGPTTTTANTTTTTTTTIDGSSTLLLSKGAEEDVEKLKEEIENQEFKKVADEKQKQTAIDMLKKGISIQQVAFLTKWTDEDIKKIK